MDHNNNLIEIVELGIVFLLLFSVIGLLVLALVRNTIDDYFQDLEREKGRWKPIIDDLLNISSMSHRLPGPKSTWEKTGFALALVECPVNGPEDYRRLCQIVQHYSIDETLASLYRRSILPFRKTFYLSTLADLPCSNQRPLFLRLIRTTRSERIYTLAFYGLSKSVANAHEAEEFLQLLTKRDMRFYFARHYCELLIHIMLRNMDLNEIGKVVDTLPMDRHVVQCFTESMGRLRQPEMEPFLRKIFRVFHYDAEVMAALIRAFFMSQAKVCDLMFRILVRPELPVRINTAKFGLDLCPNSYETMVKLVKYFFDKNYHVRQNIYQAFLRHKVPRKKILNIVKRYYPEKTHDPFFRDMMRSYATEEEI